jgi:ABC-type polysaccharide/polyol phosphate transport system ATPase subunit
MLPEGSIIADHIWKRFRPDRRRRLLRDEIERIRGRVTRRSSRAPRWALRDVNLHLEPGASLGLIGANGAGKSTLLKILTRVMYPYAGRLEVSGRVGALIEVRAGIHPDLTGRENAYLYGSLLGLSRREVSRRFDEIVAFAELEESIERQVKYYSSGMQMRLGFAVAAFLEPDILLVDEVLAVGDASFQQKCLDRMRTVLANGTSLILVSHDLGAIEATCTRGMWLRDGGMEREGDVRDVLAAYRQWIEEGAESLTSVGGRVRVIKCEVSGPNSGAPQTNKPFTIRLVVDADEPHVASLFLGVTEGTPTPIFVVRRDISLGAGNSEIRCMIDHLPLPRGRFFLWTAINGKHLTTLLPWHPARSFDVSGPTLDSTPRAVVRLAPVYVEPTWRLE